MRSKIGNHMNIRKHFLPTFRAAAAWLLLCTALGAQTSARLSSAFLVRGERSVLEVVVPSGQVALTPEIPRIPRLQIEDTGAGPMASGRFRPGRRMETVFQYIVSSYDVGKYVIPPIKVVVDGVQSFTDPIDLEIFNADDLQWTETTLSGRPVRYASAFRVSNEQPYENETSAVEIKLYVPEDLYIEDWGIPDPERDGVASWRFQPAPLRSPVNLLGQRYISVSYPSTVTPTRVGRTGIGPAKIRLTVRETVRKPFPEQVFQELNVVVPKQPILARKLPDGAPEGFDNAVGRFRLSSTSAVTEIQEGDPLSVDLIVQGSGNLDTLHPPSLENSDGWKVYGTTTEQRGDERRQLSGTVVFHQSIRPLEMKSEIPPFRLVYFDPKEGAYKSVSSDPIPVRMLPNKHAAAAAGAMVQALPIPLERMTDILPLAMTTRLTLPAKTPLPSWIGHAIGGLLAALLLAKALWMRIAPRLRKPAIHTIHSRELREIASSGSGNAGDFLKAAGAFIERRLGNDRTPEIAAILAERDSVCFRADAAKATLNPKRRNEILSVLRKAALLGILFLGLGAAPARAEDIASQAKEAYDSAKYDEALKLWFDAGKYDQLSADTLYNIGNACYRSGSPGQAALYYRRAVLRDPGHQEARQNLRFIERKYGSITVDRPDYQYALARYPLAAWKGAFWGGAWLCVLALLVFPATRRGAKLRFPAAAALVLGPLLLATGGLGWRYFPNDSQFAPVARQAVIVAEKVALHTDAARTSPEVIDAPPGSLCEILRESGRWVYVSFATKTRGWVPVESIEKIQPDQPPEPPKFRKPKAGGKTA